MDISKLSRCSKQSYAQAQDQLETHGNTSHIQYMAVLKVPSELLMVAVLIHEKILLESMQEAIIKFITRTNTSWIAKTRIYNKPKNGGLGTINLKVHASSLRMAWVKRAKGGLWIN